MSETAPSSSLPPRGGGKNPPPGSSPPFFFFLNTTNTSLPLRLALANSYNIPAVLLLAKNGVAAMITLGQKMGITTWNEPARYGLSLTLGGAEVKMTDMATVYATLANQGLKVNLHPILKVSDSQGRVL